MEQFKKPSVARTYRAIEPKVAFEGPDFREADHKKSDALISVIKAALEDDNLDDNLRRFYKTFKDVNGTRKLVGHKLMGLSFFADPTGMDEQAFVSTAKANMRAVMESVVWDDSSNKRYSLSVPREARLKQYKGNDDYTKLMANIRAYAAMYTGIRTGDFSAIASAFSLDVGNKAQSKADIEAAMKQQQEAKAAEKQRLLEAQVAEKAPNLLSGSTEARRKSRYQGLVTKSPELINFFKKMVEANYAQKPGTYFYGGQGQATVETGKDLLSGQPEYEAYRVQILIQKAPRVYSFYEDTEGFPFIGSYNKGNPKDKENSDIAKQLYLALTAEGKQDREAERTKQEDDKRTKSRQDKVDNFRKINASMLQGDELTQLLGNKEFLKYYVYAKPKDGFGPFEIFDKAVVYRMPDSKKSADQTIKSNYHRIIVVKMRNLAENPTKKFFYASADFEQGDSYVKAIVPNFGDAQFMRMKRISGKYFQNFGSKDSTLTPASNPPGGL